MSAIIDASDIACASAAADLFGGNGLSTNQQVALVAQLFADHREKAEGGLRLATAMLNRQQDRMMKAELRSDVASMQEADPRFANAFEEVYTRRLLASRSKAAIHQIVCEMKRNCTRDPN